jgi:hypothetical protein
MNALRPRTCFLGTLLAIFALAIAGSQIASAQFDRSRNGVQLAYNLPSTRQVPQAIVAEPYLSAHEFLRPRPVLLLATAPVRLEGETRFGQLFSPITSGIDSAVGEPYDRARLEDYPKSKHHNELRVDTSLNFPPAPEPLQSTPVAGVDQAEPLREQSNFRSEYIQSTLLSNVRRFAQSRGWQIGGGGLFSFGWNHSTRLMVHCGPSFRPPREAFEGERCFGVLLRFDLERRKPVH